MAENRMQSTTQCDAAADASRADRRRVLAAMGRLEAALASGASGRQQHWLAQVLSQLEQLESEMRKQDAELNSPEGLLAEIVRTQPRLEHRARRLRRQYRELLRQVAELREQLADGGDQELPDVADVRRRVGWLLTYLRHFQAQESDLVYEALQLDIGIID